MDATTSVLELVFKSLCARDLLSVGLTCKRVHRIVTTEHRAICEDFARGREAVPVRVIWYHPFLFRRHFHVSYASSGATMYSV